jgi:hypothetical protein
MNCYYKGENAMLHRDERALRLFSFALLFPGSERILFKTFIAACAVALAASMLHAVAPPSVTYRVATDVARNPQLQSPTAVAVDASGSVYIADYNKGDVFKETLTAGSYTGSIVRSGLNGVYGVAVDSHGKVYIAENGTKTVWKETLQADGSYVETVVANGSSTPPSTAHTV